MTALVIAGTSFVGRHLCQRLRARGVHVVATGRGEAAGYCDIADLQSVRELFRTTDAEWVFQCAAATKPQAPAAELYRVHVLGTLNVLRAASEFAPNAVLVFLGSAAEYGVVEDANLPVSEEHPANPTSLFGASKAGQTQLVRGAAIDWDLRVTVARPFNILGPGLPDHYLAAALARRLLLEGPTTQPLSVANANATRDFVDVRDVAEALVAVAEKAPPTAGQPCLWNIAAGVETCVLEVARTLCGWHGTREAVAVGPVSSRSRILRSCGDASRLRQATGWQPRFDWKLSLRDLWDHRRAVEDKALAS